MSIPTIFVTFLLYSLPFVSAHPLPPVIATIASSSSDLLPARTALLSARTAGSLPNNTVLTLFTTPSVSLRRAETIAKNDNVDHIRLTGDDARFPLFSLFLLPAQRVLFLSQYSLVTDSLAPLFHCPSFCASFITPCSFSSSLMVLTPNNDTHAALTSIASRLNSTCRHPPDWLSTEACILNHHFGKQLLTAPLFNPDNVLNHHPIPEPQHDQLRRFPMGCHVPHYLYYPRFQWEVPETPCGTRRAVDFRSPPLLRPWYWWTYLFMNLSWNWRSHRLQLIDTETIHKDQYDFITRMSVCLFISAVAATTFTYSFGNDDWRKLKSDLKRTTKPMDEPVLVLYVVIVGGLGCILSWIIAFLATPPVLPLPLALPLVICYQVMVQTGLWVALGVLSIKNHANAADARYPKSERRAALETCGMTISQMVFLSVALRVANVIPVETMYDRVGLLIVAGICYTCVVLWLLGRLCLVWVSVGAKESFI